MVGDKCREVLKEPAPCHSRETRRWVGCKAAELRETKKLGFGESVREAWKENRDKCKAES